MQRNLSNMKFVNTPSPAFFIRGDGVNTNDVRTGSVTSWQDDDSGMGDSMRSRSPAQPQTEDQEGAPNSKKK
jgi:hypothetical protein